MYKVMDSALRTYKGHRRSTQQGAFEWAPDWVGWANGGCIVGYGKPPNHKHVLVSPELLWCLRSMMVVNTKSPVIHTLVWQDQTFVPQWHRRVPSQWGLGGGGAGEIIQEAARRRGEGDLVYWCLVSKEKFMKERITGSVVVIQAYLRQGVASLVTTDEDAVLGVPPQCFEGS